MKKHFLAAALLTASASFSAVAEPAGEFEAAIVGEVQRQGKSHFKRGATLMDLWLSAGGVTAKADPEWATLLRDGREIKVLLTALSETPLLPGDILMVSPGKRLSVAGQVN